MPGHARRHIDRNVFEAHLIRETEEGTRLSLRLLDREEEELDRIAEDEFRANYQHEYETACRQAQEEWNPYRVAGILDGQLTDLYEDSEIDSIINERWSELRKQTRERHVNGILREINKAFERRALLEPAYETEWGFRVKSKGEKAIASALRFYTIRDQSTGVFNRINLLYEPLFRIPEENRVIIPDFVIPEYCLIIEYEGLDERNYQFGLFMKIRAIRKLGFPVVVVRPEDLNDVGKSLNQKLKFYFDFGVSETRPF